MQNSTWYSHDCLEHKTPPRDMIMWFRAQAPRNHGWDFILTGKGQVLRFEIWDPKIAMWYKIKFR